jgi:hypothetical protein
MQTADGFRQACDRVALGGIPAAITETFDYPAATPDRQRKLLHGIALSPRGDDLADALIAGECGPRRTSDR